LHLDGDLRGGKPDQGAAVNKSERHRGAAGMRLAPV
jgi:hypothetical protein